MNIMEQIVRKEEWELFLQYKMERQHLSKKEEEELRSYIEKECYIEWADRITDEEYLLPLPLRREINKGGSAKKRVIYSFPYEMNQMLKFIAFSLYRYDSMFAHNCYAFRREYGVKDAILRIRRLPGIFHQYCLKVDIHDYFNSIHVGILLDKLSFLKKDDDKVYRLFERMLTADEAVVKDGTDNIITDERPDADGRDMPQGNGYRIWKGKRGAMAGTPVSPFFANVYLCDVDTWFEQNGIRYFRYSDDILIFTDTLEELCRYQKILYDHISALHLELNPDKVKVYVPGEKWEFLGFCFRDGKVDLSENTIRKMKHKIKRKAEALRRWQHRKGLTGEKAAKGFIKAMNYKFFAKENGKDFTWTRWFFPNLTTDRGLKEIDAYMQQYIRYCVTGRHYKGNYRITYDQMKQWGYRNLVAEYYGCKHISKSYNH